MNNSLTYFLANETPESMWAERNDPLMLPFFGIQFYACLIRACEKVRKNIAEWHKQSLNAIYRFSRRKGQNLLETATYRLAQKFKLRRGEFEGFQGRRSQLTLGKRAAKRARLRTQLDPQ